MSTTSSATAGASSAGTSLSPATNVKKAVRRLKTVMNERMAGFPRGKDWSHEVDEDEEEAEEYERAPERRPWKYQILGDEHNFVVQICMGGNDACAYRNSGLIPTRVQYRKATYAVWVKQTTIPWADEVIRARVAANAEYKGEEYKADERRETDGTTTLVLR